MKSAFAAAIPPEPSRPLRTWQAEALPLVLAELEAAATALVVAVTGSGKSVLLAEAVAQILLRDPVIGTVVITTPTRRLVEQLAATLGERIGPHRVGRYYTSTKDLHRPVIVACNSSAVTLAAVLRAHQRPVALWIADEAHRTETRGLEAAANALRPRWTLGCTATPFRADEKETLRRFTKVTYRYGFRRALADGVIVPWRVVPYTGGESTVDDTVIDLVLEHGIAPGVINAASVKDASEFAGRLSAMGIPAAAVHSEQDQRSQDRLLAQLRDGRLHYVVYPSLLSEGADFPWLRTLVLRRKVGSPVRFVQEVGRVLRTHPDKDEALILDPHNLFADLSLTGDEQLGEPTPEEPSGRTGGGGGGAAGALGEATLRGVALVSAWARQLVLAARADGLLPEAAAKVLRRDLPASPRQLTALSGVLSSARWLPERHAAVVRYLAEGGHVTSSGLASDLLDVLFAVRRRRAAWVPGLPVLEPTPEQLATAEQEQEAGAWYAGGALRGSYRAVVVAQGTRLVRVEVRDDEPAHRPTPLSLAITAARLAAREAGAGAVVRVSAEAHRVLVGDELHRGEAVLRALRAPAPEVTYEADGGDARNPATQTAHREVQRRYYAWKNAQKATEDAWT